MLIFKTAKAKRVAKAAWEIVNPGYIDSPVVRYRLKHDDDHLDLTITLGYCLEISIGDKLNGKRMTMLRAKRVKQINDYIIDEFHDGDWTKFIFDALDKARKTRKDARKLDFESLAKMKAKESFTIVKGDKAAHE